MNVYESAHDLAAAIKSSYEFKDFDRLRKEIENDENLNSMVKDFEKRQMELQARQMMGENIGSDVMSEMQSMYMLMTANPKATDYMQAEARFAIMMKDVYEILSDAVQFKLDL